jgi:hypothetical protein
LDRFVVSAKRAIKTRNMNTTVPAHNKASPIFI